MDTIIAKLKDLGLNAYEAKVYIALLKKFPATGYEISQGANIPQSRAYDALKSLENEKIVFSDSQKPQKFSPVSPKELTSRCRRKFNSTIEYLEKKLPNLKDVYHEPIQYTDGYETIIEKIKEVIKNAKRSIYIEVWAEDFKYIEKDLRNAYDNEIDVKIVGYDNIKTNFGLVYNHPGGKEIEARMGRLVYLLTDASECLFGQIEAEVIHTKNPDIAFLLKEYIVHNMYLLDVEQNFPEQLKYFYGAGLKRLKEKVLSSDSEYGIH